MSRTPATDPALVADLRQRIDGARRRAAAAVNADLTLLYWQVGDRIRREILGEKRADYGEAIVSALGRELTAEYGWGFSAKNLRHLIRFAEAFPEEEIVSTLSRQLSWRYFLEWTYLKEPLAREFYGRMGIEAGWSVRRLREREHGVCQPYPALSWHGERHPPRPSGLAPDRPGG